MKDTQLPQLTADFGDDFTAFIGQGLHMQGPRLMTLHELNVAFGRHVQRPIPARTAARLLRSVHPALHQQMRALAPRGGRLKETQ